MKYETAKALKEAGFVNPEYYDGEFKCGCNEGSDVEGEERKEVLSCGRQYMYYPTISELIEVCGNDLKYIAKITIRTGESEVTDGWEVCQNVDKNEIAFAIQEFTLEEALAKFYIALKKV